MLSRRWLPRFFFFGAHQINTVAHRGHATFFFYRAIKSKYRAINRNYRAINDKLPRDTFTLEISLQGRPQEEKWGQGLQLGG